MPLVLKDRVKETTFTVGTGSITLNGAAPGYQSFSVIGDGNATYYAVVSPTQWEIGIGTYTSSGSSLSRDSILESSSGGSAVNFSVGTKEVFVTYPAERAVTGESANLVFPSPSSNGSVLRSNGSSWISAFPTLINSAASATSPLNWNSDSYDMYIISAQSENLTISADGGTPYSGKKIIFRLKDDGSPRTLVWTSGSKGFRPVGVDLPTATTVNKVTYVGCIFNSTDDVWDAIAVTTQE